MVLVEQPNKHFEPDSLRRRFGPPRLAAQAERCSPGPGGKPRSAPTAYALKVVLAYGTSSDTLAEGILYVDYGKTYVPMASRSYAAGW